MPPDHPLILAHKKSLRNREDVLVSDLCGCFDCLSIFDPSDITEWWDEDQTAVCPNCDNDTVLASASGFPIEDSFLRAMHNKWCIFMKLAAITFLVPDYDAGIDFFVGTLGFALVEDTKVSETKRWVVVAPPGGGSNVLIAKASNAEQAAHIGKAAGGRCGFFLHVAEFDAARERLEARGIEFLEDVREETYGLVAQFRDPFGNVWDLIEPV